MGCLLDPKTCLNAGRHQPGLKTQIAAGPLLLFYISITASVKHLARVLEKVNYRPHLLFLSCHIPFFFSVGYALAGVWKFATGNVEDGYFWLFGGLAIGAVVLGVFLWRRLRSAAAA
jgi:hypothetical protein